ncbi:MAG: redoxin domain-containing protein [Polyangiaceae bacterium]
MKTVWFASFAAVSLLTLSACGGSDGGDPPKQNDFDKGSVVNNGTGGGDGGSATEAPFKSYDYPPGPYGTKVDSIIAPLDLLGWKKPAEKGYDAAQFEPINIAEYYNPDGKKSVKLLWINSSAVWCGPCNAEYAQLRDENIYATDIAPKGVEIIGTLMENGANPPGPATPVNLTAWGKKYEVAFPLALDPAFKIAAYFEQATVPGGLLVDTKTMKIVAKLAGGAVTGSGGVLQEIDAALANL